MGRPKALLPWRGEPLVSAHVRALRSWADRVIVVTGASEISHALCGAETVDNARWQQTWPADSLRLALLRAPGARTAIVTPVDVIPASSQTLVALAGERSAVPVDARGCDGHPVWLGPRELAVVRAGAPSGGLRTILGEAKRVQVTDPLIGVDFDDEVAWRAVTRGEIGH